MAKAHNGIRAIIPSPAFQSKSFLPGRTLSIRESGQAMRNGCRLHGWSPMLRRRTVWCRISARNQNAHPASRRLLSAIDATALFRRRSCQLRTV